MTGSALAPYRRLVALCLLVSCFGCAETGTKVTSRAGGTKIPAGQRLLVISRVAWVDVTWSESFGKAVLSELKRVDAVAAVQQRTPLALQEDKAAYAKQVAEFRPDIVLAIEPGDGTVDQNGKNLIRKFEIGLFKNYMDRERRDLIWRASIEVDPAGYYIMPSDMTVLARDLVDRLIADKVLAKPRRAVRAATPPHNMW